jgi:hypothetical protein
MKTRLGSVLVASVLALALSSCSTTSAGPAAPDVGELAEAAASLSLLTDLPPERVLEALARASAPVSQPAPVAASGALQGGVQ